MSEGGDVELVFASRGPRWGGGGEEEERLGCCLEPKVMGEGMGGCWVAGAAQHGVWGPRVAGCLWARSLRRPGIFYVRKNILRKGPLDE